MCTFESVLTLNVLKLFWKKDQSLLSIALQLLYSYNLNNVKSIRFLLVAVYILIPFLYYFSFAFQSMGIVILRG